MQGRTTAGTAGIHHVTAIASDAQRNVDFYAGVLGLRLVKRTVNFDDPGTYHLYYGDEQGTPGTILTFFPWDQLRRGRPGPGQVAAIRFAAPLASLGDWTARLVRLGVHFDGPVRRFNEPLITLSDPDGLAIEIGFTTRADAVPGWAGGPVPVEAALRGIDGVTIEQLADLGTREVLVAHLGFTEQATEGEYARFTTGAPIGGRVDLRTIPGAVRALGGVGTVHHIAFRADDLAHQRQLAESLQRAGMSVTTVQDRSYFQSVYSREPGGVLFEVATDGPGFAIDEPVAALGTALQLPAQYERMRADLEAVLQPLVLPGPTAGGPAVAEVA